MQWIKSFLWVVFGPIIYTMKLTFQMILFVALFGIAGLAIWEAVVGLMVVAAS